MSNIFTLENVENFSEKLNIDELYEKKRQKDLRNLALFNKMLNRIHVHIKTTARQQISQQFCWFLVPEIIIGVSKYDQGACIAYLMDRLKTNGFNVRYIHPNMLFISWDHFVPSYVRSELKKKTGIVIDENGRQIAVEEGNENEANHVDESDPNNFMISANNLTNDPKNNKQKKEYTPIKSYRPSGNLVYDDALLDRLENKFRK